MCCPSPAPHLSPVPYVGATVFASAGHGTLRMGIVPASVEHHPGTCPHSRTCILALSARNAGASVVASVIALT